MFQKDSGKSGREWLKQKEADKAKKIMKILLRVKRWKRVGLVGRGLEREKKEGQGESRGERVQMKSAADRARY